MTTRRFLLCSTLPLCLMSVAQAQSITEPDFLLDPIIVGSGLGKVASETPQSVSVVTAEEIDRAQASTVGELVETLPGVSVFGSEQVLGQQINIRGIGTGQDGDQNSTITRIDGVEKFYQQYRMGALFTEPELFNRVEILRGPASSTLTGAGAVGGVIELETKDASDFLDGPSDRFGGRQRFEFDSNGDGFLSSTILAARPVENLELLGFFAYRERDDLDDPDGEAIEGTNFDAQSYLLKAKYFFGEDQTHEVFATYQNWYTDQKDSNYEQTGFNAFFGTVDREVDDSLFTVGYNYNPADNDLIDFELRYGYSNTEVIQTDPTGNFPSVLFEDAEYGYESWQLNASNTSRFSLGITNWNMTYGFDASRQDRSAMATSRRWFNTPPNGFIRFQPGGTDENVGIYAQAEIEVGDRVTVIPGLRYEWQEVKPDSLNTTFSTSDKVENEAFAPKIAVLVDVTETINVFGTLAQTERLPVIDEIFDGSSGNLDLKPEKAETWELGASYSGTDVVFTGDQLVGKIVYFNNELEDVISRVNTSSPFLNIDEATYSGWELEASYDTDFAFGNLAYTQIRADGSDNGVGDDPLSDIPADELSLTIGSRLPSLNLEFGARGTFTWDQDRVPPGQDTAKGYQVYDIFGSWTPDAGVLEGAEVRVAVDNLFNEAYSPALFVGDPDTNRAAGRSVRLSLAYNF